VLPGDAGSLLQDPLEGLVGGLEALPEALAGAHQVKEDHADKAPLCGQKHPQGPAAGHAEPGLRGFFWPQAQRISLPEKHQGGPEVDLGPAGQGGFAVEEEGDGLLQEVKPLSQRPRLPPDPVGGAHEFQEGLALPRLHLPGHPVEEGPDPARGGRGSAPVKGVEDEPAHAHLQKGASPGLGEEVDFHGVGLEAGEEGFRAFFQGGPPLAHGRSLMHHPGGEGENQVGAEHKGRLLVQVLVAVAALGGEDAPGAPFLAGAGLEELQSGPKPLGKAAGRRPGVAHAPGVAIVDEDRGPPARGEGTGVKGVGKPPDVLALRQDEKGQKADHGVLQGVDPPGDLVGGDHLGGMEPDGLGGERDLRHDEGDLLQDASREEALLHVSHHPFPEDYPGHVDPVAHGLPRKDLQGALRSGLGVVLLKGRKKPDLPPL